MIQSPLLRLTSSASKVSNTEPRPSKSSNPRPSPSALRIKRPLLSRYSISSPPVLKSIDRSGATEISENLDQRSNEQENAENSEQGIFAMVCGFIGLLCSMYLRARNFINLFRSTKKIPFRRQYCFTEYEKLSKLRRREPECKKHPNRLSTTKFRSMIPWKFQRRRRKFALCASWILPVRQSGKKISKRTLQRSNAKYFWRNSPRFNLNLQHLSVDDHDIAVIRDLAEPCESYLRAHSLSDLRFDLPGNVIVRRHNNDDNFYSQMLYKYSVICKALTLPFSLRHSHCHFPKSMHFYLPETWLCTDVDDLRTAIFESLNPHETFDLNAKIDNFLVKYFPHIPPELEKEDLTNGDLEKYWKQRYRFFTLFDKGIHINREGLFSVTPEVLAIHHARRLLRLTPKRESLVALDLFTGVGGNCIQLALAGFKVVTVDINREMTEMAKKNAEVYGVAGKIEFVCSDAFKFLRENKDRYDAILASPPWGGPEYSQHTFSLADAKISGNLNIFHLVEAVAPKIRSGGPVALYLPRNTNAAQLFDLHQRFIAADPLDVAPCLECEMDIINYKAKAMTIYLHFGEQGGFTSQNSNGGCTVSQFSLRDLSHSIEEVPEEVEQNEELSYAEESLISAAGTPADSIWACLHERIVCTVS
ncbi:unnamed protein product [Hymenolepis diminuta]|uniref:Trimethylguanosine synthase n=1 Tax=Hymenolepis diminuta TaxID=6216 RepID=A0A564Z2H3_HYMDI|nr:unnamed protein product [Hymenolepis diminuta]